MCVVVHIIELPGCGCVLVWGCGHMPPHRLMKWSSPRKCHEWQIAEGVCVCVCVWDVCVCACVQTGRWCLMGMRGANDLERQKERKSERKRERERKPVAAGVSLFCGEGRAGRAGHFCCYFLPAFPPLTQCARSSHTHTRGALTEQDNEQGLARGRLSKVFPVTRTTAASTLTHLCGTTPARVRRPVLTLPSFN